MLMRRQLTYNLPTLKDVRDGVRRKDNRFFHITLPLSIVLHVFRILLAHFLKRELVLLLLLKYS